MFNLIPFHCEYNLIIGFVIFYTINNNIYTIYSSFYIILLYIYYIFFIQLQEAVKTLNSV